MKDGLITVLSVLAAFTIVAAGLWYLVSLLTEPLR